MILWIWQIQYHLENECELFSENKVAFPPNIEIQSCYKGIAVIRGLLLKEKDAEAWKNLLTLQYRTELEATPTPDMDEFRKVFGLPNFGQVEDWERILGILNVNSYSIQRMERTTISPT